jgi:hypothetical protein
MVKQADEARRGAWAPRLTNPARSLLITALMVALAGTDVVARAQGAGADPEGAAEDWARYVSPFIGTGGHGHTYPGATLPSRTWRRR